jgi:hypothetical protein
VNAHLIADLETLGQRPGAVIVDVGLVVFSAGNPYIDGMRVRIDIQSSMDLGFEVDAATLVWWMEQNDAARHTVFSMKRSPTGNLSPNFLHVGLASRKIHDFIVGVNPAGVWSNGPSFDLSMLAVLFQRCGLDMPWNFRAERCFRTISAMYSEACPTEPRDGGVKHSAFDDALWEAARLVQFNEHDNNILG